MPVNIRSFDVIIGRDCLSPHHVDIMCHEKFVRLHQPTNKTLIIDGDKPGAKLLLILCLHKKDHAFLDHVVDKQKEENNIKDIPEVRDLPDVFPKDLPRIPP